MTFEVTICDDVNFEPHETAHLALGTPVGATLGAPSTAQLTIANDDPEPASRFIISGRVMTDSGRGLSGATVTITDSAGTRRNAITSSAGYFTFEDVPGGSATVTAISKRFRFSPRDLQVTADKLDVDFVGVE